ncbi:antifreeze-related protein [Mycena alexandri]|uniref:Antifreeze-related protein n=1 Tax=Mycena alexandri TaxID=1745969 RepID=A0AAD6T0V1_9AGAR|nr:antifreeze-related protein [Mycena alexandri]
MISSFLTISFLATIGQCYGSGRTPAAVNLRTAGNYAILAKTGITCVPTCRENIGISPAASTFITGCSLILDSSGKFSTSSQVTGEVFAADYAAPTPATLTVAIGDMQTAIHGRYRPCTAKFPESWERCHRRLILAPGLYHWSSGVTINSDVTIAGGASDTWIFQVIGTLTMANAVHMTLTGGALPKNIVWVVTGAVTTGTTSVFQGVILGKTGITLKTGIAPYAFIFVDLIVPSFQATVNN